MATHPVNTDKQATDAAASPGKKDQIFKRSYIDGHIVKVKAEQSASKAAMEYAVRAKTEKFLAEMGFGEGKIQDATKMLFSMFGKLMDVISMHSEVLSNAGNEGHQVKFIEFVCDVLPNMTKYMTADKVQWIQKAHFVDQKEYGPIAGAVAEKLMLDMFVEKFTQMYNAAAGDDNDDGDNDGGDNDGDDDDGGAVDDGIGPRSVNPAAYVAVSLSDLMRGAAGVATTGACTCGVQGCPNTVTADNSATDKGAADKGATDNGAAADNGAKPKFMGAKFS